MEKKAKSFISEFKEFISRGSVMDMAVGIIVGAAFTAIVNSLVNGIIMPLIGFLIGGINFEDFKIVLSTATKDTPEVAILYGSFIQQVVNFLVIAFVVFLMVKAINRFRERIENLKKKDEQKIENEEKGPTETEILLEIRDLLKENDDDRKKRDNE